MPEAAPDPTRPSGPDGSLAVLGLSALGIVFGDIGTSPLYTLKTVLDAAGAHPTRLAVLGSLSLIVWTLIVVTSVKYVSIAMRIDNDGEGGILALMSLLGIKQKQRRAIVLAGLFGAALIYGDGAVTPAISVLSALEGLNILVPGFAGYVVPLAVLILLVLFAAQSQGTARIGRLFGPIMTVWFGAIALLGLYGIARHPAVLAGLSPSYAIAFLVHGGDKGFEVLGGVFLCVTGAEALYADMGHFGPRPIRAAWTALVLPSLVLSYAGQAALVLSGASTADNIFYRLCPPLLLPALVLLATVATIIASQAIITGAFSMTRQAIELGWLPRLGIVQTSEQGYGQIYVGAVNWALMAVTLGLVIGFRKSDNLAAAYGIAVSLTMLMTTVLLFIALREIWGWRLAPALALAGALFVVDAAFVSANMRKIAEGGYVPLGLAVLVYALMLVWHRGAEALRARVRAEVTPIAELPAMLAEAQVTRVAGSAVFLTRAERAIPPVLRWYVHHSRAVQEQILVLNVVTALVPRVAEDSRLELAEVAPGLWYAHARFGFIERPDVPALLARAYAQGCEVDPDRATYFIGRENVLRLAERPRLPGWIVATYAFLLRNAERASDHFMLPPDQVIEIGREIAI
ncbi:MAG: KUP/HAK/KT family potassium transporter [Rhodospirillales bacterium]|nr:KUP/HAK/KT family potassium transporter [Rhodospirillales bacterium]